jgi:hypothetical protein
MNPEGDTSICRNNAEQNLSLQWAPGPEGRSGPAGRPVHARYTYNSVELCQIGRYI